MCVTVRNYTLPSLTFLHLGLDEGPDLQVPGARGLEDDTSGDDDDDVLCDGCYGGIDDCNAVASFTDDLDGLVYLLSVEKEDPDSETSDLDVGVTSLIRILPTEDDPRGGGEETGTPTSSPDGDGDERNSDDPVCFPANANLELIDGSSVPMRQLRVGDMIRSGDNSFAEVYFFSHRDEYTEATFVELSCGQHTLRISPSHYVISGSGLLPAGSIVPGDTIYHVTGGAMKVDRVQNVKGVGLYAPHTLAARPELYVDGFRVSEFTTAVHPKAARLLLMPLKLAYISVYRPCMNNFWRAVAFGWGSRLASRVLQRSLISRASGTGTSHPVVR